ncbi:MAG: DUF2339 domain-containing protein [Dehalococcoidia bacterium]|nr:DUF2339 domain-containing protein [Dehalococcoidia bacterium]
MSNEAVCPKCLRANEASSAYCIGCGYRLTSGDVRSPTSPDRAEDDREIRVELASVRNELAHAAALLQRLQRRVEELESRRRRPTAQPERVPDVQETSDAETPPTPSAPISEDVVTGRRRLTAPAPATEVESGEAQPASRPEPVRDAERGPRPAEPAAAGAPETVVRREVSELVRTQESEWPEWIRIDWEQTLGRNWFAIVGALAVVLGIGFFLKLAFDNNWINDAGRVILGAAVGLALLGGGEYAQRRVPRWAQPVTAGGTAILYLSIYAAFGLYDLIPPDAAFALLAVVVAVASLLALRYESMVIGLLGVVGAFISPVLLGPELSDLRLLGLYILLVDLGILGISTFRNWRWFTLAGLVGSYGLFASGLEYYPDFDPVLTQIVLTGVFLTFAAATPLFHILWRRMPGPADLSLMSLNATGYFVLTFLILWDGYSEWFGLIAFSLSAFYGLIALLAFRRSGTSARVTVFSLGIAVVFLTMGFPLQLDGYSVAIAWAAQGAMFVWMGFYLVRWQTRVVGLAVLALAVAHLLLFDMRVDLDGFIPVLNWRFLTAAIVVAAFYAAGFFYWHGRDAEGRLEVEKFASPILLGIANLITLGLFSLELIDYYDSRPYAEYVRGQDNLKFLSLTVLWAVYGSAVASVGLVRNHPMARWAGLGLLALATLKLLVFDAFNVDLDSLSFIPVLNIRFLAFAIVLTLVSGLAFWFGRARDRLTEYEAYVFQNLVIAANVVALWTLSQEITHYFDSLEAKNQSDYFSAMHLSLTVLWAVYGSVVALVGLARRQPMARWAGLGLLSLAAVKLLGFDALELYLDPLTFTPVLNIRFLAFAIVLALVSGLAFWFGRARDRLAEEEVYVFPALLIVANFVALWTLSQEVIHFFDSLGVKNDDTYINSTHLALTVLWAVYAMGVISAGIAVRSRWVRLAGIGLLIIPVAKLFVFDVFLLHMEYRVAAFLTLGVLLLAMGLVYQRYSRAVRGFVLGRR